MTRACTIVALAILLAGTALAGEVAVGPRLGYTHDSGLDQFHLGGQVVFPNLSRNIHAIPSAEVGFGDGTLFALNADLVYEFTELASGRWSFFAGGGPTITHYTNSGFDSTDIALSLVGGSTWEWRERRQLFAELRFGLEDAPAFKVSAGLNFF
jgi:hypothetical protein